MKLEYICRPLLPLILPPLSPPLPLVPRVTHSNIPEFLPVPLSLYARQGWSTLVKRRPSTCVVVLELATLPHSPPTPSPPWASPYARPERVNRAGEDGDACRVCTLPNPCRAEVFEAGARTEDMDATSTRRRMEAATAESRERRMMWP